MPEFELCDRLDRALRYSGMGVAEMADALGMSVASVGRWINGRGTPKRAAILAWASLTGVDAGWLESGYAIRDSNPEPADLESRWVLAA